MANKKVREAIIQKLSSAAAQALQSSLARTFYTRTVVGTPRCGVPAPCRRGTGASPSVGFMALATGNSAADRGGDGAARHPYLCFTAPGGYGYEIFGPSPRFRVALADHLNSPHV
ncbi:MAG: hypothetical protein ABI651_10095 [Verrucomicrobiota bacterium]